MPRPVNVSDRALSWLLLTAGTALIGAAVSLFLIISAGVIEDTAGSSGPGTVTGFGSVLTIATSVVPPAPASPVSTAPLNRLIIPQRLMHPSWSMASAATV